jgi:hypothetical protein
MALLAVRLMLPLAGIHTTESLLRTEISIEWNPMIESLVCIREHRPLNPRGLANYAMQLFHLVAGLG